eukprot:GFKZ01011094.1.p1 GENE.GFKZ01011094.1~~GFKZ01011094.1.p1  ORF type:complete len:179 (+),score=29.51 GFKZ01011094.1:279-815(+)
MSNPGHAPPAREANPVVLDALEMIIRTATTTVSEEIDPAIKDMHLSQQGLESQLNKLDSEMTSITKVLKEVTLDPQTSARMQETREVLNRTKEKLTTIKNRLEGLRAYEERDRLHLVEHELVEKGAEGRGTVPARVSRDDLWSQAGEVEGAVGDVTDVEMREGGEDVGTQGRLGPKER